MANGLNKELLNLNTILLSKLEMYGIRNNELRWFHNYLTGRSQVVSVNGAISDSHDIHVGVPGPWSIIILFFFFLINDLPSVVNNCKITFDTGLFFSSKSVHEIQTVLSSELKHINNWFKNNKLTLNVSKTKYTLIGTSQLLKSKSPNLILSIDNILSLNMLLATNTLEFTLMKT